jgi:single-strand DNA-binding protein
MKSMNKVQLIGWLGKDPEFLTTRVGNQLAKLKLATDNFIYKEGALPQKFTTWHTVVIWREKQLGNLKNNIIKGSHILVDGRIVYRTYEDKVGHTRYITEIIANYIVDLDR